MAEIRSVDVSAIRSSPAENSIAPLDLKQESPTESIGSSKNFQYRPAQFNKTVLTSDAREFTKAISAPRVRTPDDVLADLIPAEAVLKHIREISDDKYEGRDSPSDGLDKAAAYISAFAGVNGLVGADGSNEAKSFYQPFHVYNLKSKRGSVPKSPGNKHDVFGPTLFEFAVHDDEYKKRRNKRSFRNEFDRTDGHRAVNNIVGFLEGSDSVLKKEYVIVSAHYDHIGMGRSGEDRIYNGADDNASGVAVLMSLLPALAKLKSEGKGPRRSIVFLWTAAEEKGLLGASQFLRHPPVPIEKITAAINVDMVGGLSAEQISVCDIDGEGRPNFFRAFEVEAAKQAGFSHVDNNIDDYIDRQDGSIFVDAGIPTLFMFEGFLRCDSEGKNCELNPRYHDREDDFKHMESDNEGKKATNAARMTLRLLLSAANR